MPMDRSRYPSNWSEISRRIRDQAGNRCEWCGVENGATGYRDRTGAFHVLSTGTCEDPDWRCIRIVLTVAHLCHDPSCTDETHMVALCQKDHLAYDRDHHQRNAAETRRRKRRAAGQLEILA
jgi:hypothetical protein